MRVPTPSRLSIPLVQKKNKSFEKEIHLPLASKNDTCKEELKILEKEKVEINEKA